MALRNVVLAFALGLAPMACGSDASGGPGDTSQVARPPASLCDALTVRRTGRVDDPMARELSGLVASRTQRGVLWTHNDSGDGPRVFAIRADGLTLGSFTVSGARALDWEDIATGPAPDGRGSYLFAGDIGDNDARRERVVVYRFPEPDADAGGGATRPAEALTLRYPDIAHDAEALLADPLRGDLMVVTKELDGAAGVYLARAAELEPGRTVELRLAARVDLGLGRMITAGSVSADGLTVALRTLAGLVVWSRRRAEAVPAALRREPCVSPTRLDERQGEALAVLRGGRAAVTVTEGPGPLVRRYTPHRPS